MDTKDATVDLERLVQEFEDKHRGDSITLVPTNRRDIFMFGYVSLRGVLRSTES